MLNFIVNPSSSSGNASKIWEHVTKKLAKEGISYSAHLTDGPGSATRLAKQICESDPEPTIVVLGGDGTVNETMCGITDFSKVTFGYIPAGSSNDFARDLSLTNDYAEALEGILHPTHTIMLDIGKVTAGEDKRNFAVSCGMGYDASICFEALHSNLKDFLNKIHLGKLTYVLLAIKMLAKAPKLTATIKIDDNEPVTFKKFYLQAAMIHRYEGGGIMFCPEAKYDDGVIDLCIVNNISKLKILRVLPTAYSGGHTKFKGVTITKGSKITVTTSIPVHVHTDGEPCGIHSEAVIELNAAQLKMVY